MEINKTVNAQGWDDPSVVIETNKRNTAVELLNELIGANRGIIRVYETAVEQLETSSNVRLLQSFAEQHQRFVAELSNMVVRFSGQPNSSGNSSSLIKQAWVSLKAAVTEGDGPVLAEVAQDAENILIAYGEAMSKDIPEDARQLIRNHISDVRLAHKKLSALSVAYTSK